MREKRNGRILIVDDDPNFVTMLSEAFSNGDFKIWTATDGFDAIEIIKNTYIHLVISDICMPKMDGVKMLTEIKKINPEIKIILVTAFGDVESYLEAMDMGAYEYFNKPVNFEELRLFVNMALRSSNDHHSKVQGKPPYPLQVVRPIIQ